MYSGTDFYEAVMGTYAQAVSNYRDRGIDYITKYGNKFIPKDKWWSWDTIKGIKMPYGLMNGDPTMGLNVSPEIGDANVHSILAGATGAGKSAAINQILVSLITMYPPSELQIVYIDFKNVEAAKFTHGYVDSENRWMTKKEQEKLVQEEAYFKRLSRIPHLRIISGTTDGGYALSVFSYLMDEMARRQKVINKAGLTKLQAVRERLLNNYNKEHGTPKGTWRDMRMNREWYKENVEDVYGDISRLLVICDEFQVMFNPEFVPVKITNKIQGQITAITKLARAMGAHLWFTSQSMKGTLSKDTLGNFSLRGALRCDADTSNEILGNPASSTITAKFGYMYSNDSAGTDKGRNRLWRVPFLADDHKPNDHREFRDMFDYVDALYPLLDKYHEVHNMVEFYDEKVLVPEAVLKTWYDTQTVFDDPTVFIAGERAEYSTNKAPFTITLVRDMKENICLAAQERIDLINLVLTFMKNLKYSKGDYDMIVSCFDNDMYTLLDLEHEVDPKFLPLASPKQDALLLVSALLDIVDRRMQLETTSDLKSIFVFALAWPRNEDICNNYKLQDNVKKLFTNGPTVGVHIIFGLQDKGDFPPRLIKGTMRHLICGALPNASAWLLNSVQADKLPTLSDDKGSFAIYENLPSESKFRIYQHTLQRQLKSRDIVIE